MKKSEVFEEQLMLISDENKRALVAEFLDNEVPDYFFTAAASSTGKYHPAFAQGKGGLVRHTKAAVKVAQELMVLDNFSNTNKDAVFAALILHDTFKMGEPKNCGNQYTVVNHGEIAAAHWLEYATNKSRSSFHLVVYECLLWHMGQWSGKKILESYGKNPLYDEEREMVALCDYIASRKFINYREEGER